MFHIEKSRSETTVFDDEIVKTMRRLRELALSRPRFPTLPFQFVTFHFVSLRNTMKRIRVGD
ncbi:MAG: hypothetical protein IT350_02865 [Deltaproteobacteria bacterium]|nr:hypothetical protein [Deltaproteobacteria bacterium]